MKDELLKELIDETRMEDIAERYQELRKSLEFRSSWNLAITHEVMKYIFQRLRT